MAETIQLPAFVFEENLGNLVAALSAGDLEARSIMLDFGNVKYYIPIGVTMVISAVGDWLAHGKEIQFSNHKNNAAFRYLQRIDFFKHAGLLLDEDFERHPSGSAFVPIEEVQIGGGTSSDKSASALATCLVDTEDAMNPVYQLTQYCVGEIISNCKQHSLNRGFASAQYAPKSDMARIGIADRGVGILESFRQNQSPHYRDGMSDADALLLALQPQVSSKTHLPKPAYGHVPNLGIGLSMISQLVAQTLGKLCIVSGTGVLLQDGNRKAESKMLLPGYSFHGTAVSVGFKRSEIVDYKDLQQNAWKAVELTNGQDADSLFL
ncbi:MAG: hypothetical protein KDN22_29205 [Verrucomicrobiae bacterium]|nr:hypothetical protein [Verrucomicrobiae bacterium]